MPAIKPGKPGQPPADVLERVSPEDMRSAGEGVQTTVDSARSQDGPVPDAVIDAGRAQALSMAMLDAAGHLRRVETLALAAMARGLEAILDGDTERGAATLEASEANLDRAIGRLARLVDLSRSPADASPADDG